MISCRLSYESLAQSVEHLPFKQVVPGSIPGRLTIKCRVKVIRKKAKGKTEQVGIMKPGYKNNIAWQKNQQAIIKALILVESFPGTAPFKNIASQLFSSITTVVQTV